MERSELFKPGRLIKNYKAYPVIVGVILLLAVIPAFINVVRVSHEVGGNIYGGIFIGMPESDWCRIGVYETYQEYDESHEHKL